MKIILQIVGGAFLLFAIVAGLSSAKEWLILNSFSGYQKERFTITGTRADYGTGDSGTDYYLIGHGEQNDCEFAISAARYRALSSAGTVGQEVTVFRNPSMPSIAFQKESVGVIFEDEWRERAEVEVSAKSTMWIGIIATLVAVLAFVSARSLSLR